MHILVDVLCIGELFRLVISRPYLGRDMSSLRIRNGTLVPIVAAIFLQACSTDNQLTQPTVAKATASGDSTPFERDGPLNPIARRLLTTIADLELTAEGSFKIHQPVNLRAAIHGKYSVPQARVVVSVRGGGRFVRGQESTTRSRELALSDGQELAFENEIIFDEPGYYEVTASVASIDGKLPRTKGDSTLLHSDERSAWIYIGENGGKFDRVFNAALLSDAARYMEYGSYGPFRKATPAQEPDSAKAAQLTRGIRSSASLMSDPVMSGTVMFTSLDNGIVGQLQPLQNVLIDGYCTYAGFNVGHFTLATNSAGQFSVTCPSYATKFQGLAKLESSSARIGWLNGSTYANFNIDIDANATDTIATIPEMGVVFRNHQLYNLQAPSVFGRSMGQIKYIVNPGEDSSSYFDYGSNVYMYSRSYWNPFGRFVTAHEYGHAFHWKAIEQWRTYACVGDEHDFHTVETSSCAYVEGFADFFAFWMLRNEVVSNQYFSNNDIEINNHPSLGSVQGIFVEFFFAATLWDLVDDSSTPDASNYYDEDNNSLSPSDIANIMSRCRLYNPNDNLISHTDQFVYCTEYGVNNARAWVPSQYQSNWWIYGTMTWDGGTPTLPYLSFFRDSWRKNFYGL